MLPAASRKGSHLPEDQPLHMLGKSGAQHRQYGVDKKGKDHPEEDDGMAAQVAVQTDGTEEYQQYRCQTEDKAGQGQEQVVQDRQRNAADDDEGSTQGSAGGYAQCVGGSKRILQKRLYDRAAQREHRTDDKGTGGTGDTNIPEDRNHGGRDVSGEFPAEKLMKKDRHDLSGGQGDAPEPHGQDHDDHGKQDR